ncbi:MAG: hypothetical protein WC761_02195 [Candidatus Paceibacterota bacterium]|jgi:hypothetical protein
MKITQDELKTLIREALKAKLERLDASAKLAEAASSLQKDVLPGSMGMSEYAEEVDTFLMDTAEKAKELCEKMEEEMKVDMLGGENPSMAPRVGERNRMLSTRIGALKKLAGACSSIFEMLRREG